MGNKIQLVGKLVKSQSCFLGIILEETEYKVLIYWFNFKNGSYLSYSKTYLSEDMLLT